MYFGILGPLQVALGEDNILSLTGPYARKLLAILLLRHDEAMPSSVLAEQLYGEFTKRASSTIRGHILTIRTSVLGDIIESGPLGYSVKIGPHGLDLMDFERLAGDGFAAIAAGDHVRGRDSLSKAVLLWRDPELADLPDTTALRPRLEHLRDTYRRARHALNNARLSLGEHREVVSELRSAAAAEPFNESIYHQLMTALYRCGLQGEAYQAYHQLRRTLSDEFGASPGSQLQLLYHRMLRSAPELDDYCRPGDVVLTRTAPPRATHLARTAAFREPSRPARRARFSS